MSDTHDCRTCDYWRRAMRGVVGLPPDYECRNLRVGDKWRMMSAVNLGEVTGCPGHSRHEDEAKARAFERQQGRLFA